MAYLARDLKRIKKAQNHVFFIKIMMKPVNFEFIDESGDSDKFHFGDFVNSSFV